MLTPFEYKRIGQDLIDDVEMTIERGESVLLLGPRFIGKRHLTQHVKDQLIQNTGIKYIDLRFQMRHVVHTEQDLWMALHRALQAGTEESWNYELLALDFTGEVQRYLATHQLTLVIAISNVDALPDYLTRRLLSSLRILINRPVAQGGRIVALLTAEVDPSGLVHGENSEINCNRQIFLQGFEKSWFIKYSEKYCAALKLGSVPMQPLFEKTRGDIGLLRWLLRDLLESRLRQDAFLSAPIELAEIETLLTRTTLSRNWSEAIAVYVTPVVEGSLAACEALIDLLEGKEIKVGPMPHMLERAGIAVRNPEHLEFSSPLMEQFTRHYYTDRRRGHVFALHQEWERSFFYYKRSMNSPTGHITAKDTLVDLQITLRSVEAGLHAMATDGPEAVQALLANSAHYILGFPEISFWRYADGWNYLEGTLDQSDQKAKSECQSILPLEVLPATDQVKPVGDAPPWAVWAVTPIGNQQEWQAVVLADTKHKEPYSRERYHLASNLLLRFFDSLKQAYKISHDRERLVKRDQHIAILDSILDALGAAVHGSLDVLKLAARKMRALGYRRVAFSLVNPERTRIRGAWDDNDDGIDTAKMMDFALTEADVVCYVVKHKSAIRIKDALSLEAKDGTGLTVDHEIVRAADIRGMALIPMVSHNQVIGTIQIERNDKRIPGLEETEDLTLFAKQLATIIVQSEREHMLGSALNQVREPLMIVNRQNSVRYLNGPAEPLFDFRYQAGFRTPDMECPFVSEIGAETVHSLNVAINERHPIVRHIKYFDFKDFGQKRVSLFAAPLLDWRDECIGGVLQIKDISYLHGLFEVFEAAGQAKDFESLITILIGGTKVLGHSWGRLYLIDPEAPRCLVGRAQYGLSETAADKFNAGEIRLTNTGDPRQQSLKCIQEGIPKIFSWNASYPDQQEYETAYGLSVFNAYDPPAPPAIKEALGDYWIDFPLIARDRDAVLGKISLSCSEALNPEDFELLCIFSEVASALIDGFRVRKALEEEKLRLQEEAVQRSISETSHNLSGRLAPLALLCSRYEDAYEKLSATTNSLVNGTTTSSRVSDSPYHNLQVISGKLYELNTDFQKIVTKLYDDIERLKRTLAPGALRIGRHDLIKVVQGSLAAALRPQECGFRSLYSELECDIDPDRIEMIILELIQNSQKAAKAKAMKESAVVQATVKETDYSLYVTIDIETFERNAELWVRMVYQDNGPGIPKQYKDRIFEKYFRRSPQQIAGTGLGLFFLSDTIRMLSGSVRECGVSGKGALFLIEFPRFQTS